LRITGPFWGVANLLSIARVPLALMACWFIWRGDTTATAVSMLLAIATDGLDGWVARRTGTESDWGRVLDPLADKLAFAVFLVTLTLLGRVPLWLAAAVIGRDLLIALGGLAIAGRLGSPPSANVWGKLSTCLLAAYLVRQALWPSKGVLLGVGPLGLAAVGLVIASLFVYISTSMPKLRGGKDQETG
jgi:CDP-diacylglycerol--glycerol-3-phosphate 3-phosphatidyltransferase